MCEEITNGRIVNIEMDDLVSVPLIHLNLRDLVEDACYETEDGEYCVVHCQPASRNGQECPICHSKLIKVHGYLPQDRLVHDVNAGIQQVDLRIKVPRYQCTDCNYTFTHRFESILENKQMTKRLYDVIKRETFVDTFSNIADRYGVTAPTIAGIFDDYVAELEPLRKRLVAPRILGIDEKHIVHAMRGVFVDIEEGTLLEMVAANKREDIITAIESMEGCDENIQIVTMDMSGSYRSYVQECLPNAKIIVDKFHVFQSMGSKVTKVRTNIINYLDGYLKTVPSGPQKHSMELIFNAANKDHYLFKYGTDKIMEDQQRVVLLAKLCQFFPEFNHLRMIKEGFEKIYASFDRDAAETAYREWLPLIPPSGTRQQEAWRTTYGVDPALFMEFRTMANTFKNWYDEIFGYFDPGCSVTNAATEGLNNLIERFNRLGNEYSFERLRAKALYCHLAGSKRHFVLKTKKLPVYQPTGSGYTTAYLGTEGFDLSKALGKVAKYKEERTIEEVMQEHKPRKALSVFSYLPRPQKDT